MIILLIDNPHSGISLMSNSIDSSIRLLRLKTLKGLQITKKYKCEPVMSWFRFRYGSQIIEEFGYVGCG